MTETNLFLTPEKASEMTCPMSGTGCIAGKCPVWRWQPLMADPDFAKAVASAIGTTPEGCEKLIKSNAQAAPWVAAHRADYGLRTERFQGWCGLGGVPS